MGRTIDFSQGSFLTKVRLRIHSEPSTEEAIVEAICIADALAVTVTIFIWVLNS